MKVHYLEIVTPDVEATCDTLEQLHGVAFGAPVAVLGNARMAPLGNGGQIGVRAPMGASEAPIVRPYMLVDDIDAATRAAQAAGGQLAHAPTELTGYGRFAIYLQAGVHYGLWQV